MSSRKRSRAGIDENRAECPFKVNVPIPNEPETADKHVSKKRKKDGAEEERKTQMQLSPFAPVGKFKTYETLDLYYSVEPRKRWLDMTRYNSFVLNGQKYFSEGFVFVANESTIERQKLTSADGTTMVRKSTDDWVARILEIRASDEHHVYARVYWMYWPDELPQGTLDGKKMVQGRQAYHGQNELIASNHMDIINVVSVTMPATVNQMIESDDEEIQDALYWRQAFDVRTSQLSSVELVCKCETPGNPDKRLIGCAHQGCEKWLHEDCLVHDVLMRVYEQLGTDKPHVSASAVKKEKDEAIPARPLSPTETNRDRTQPTIDVKPDGGADQVTVKKSEEDPSKPSALPIHPAAGTVAATQSQNASPRGSTPLRTPVRKGRKKEGKPYQGLFEATLKMTDGPTTWEIRDLRGLPDGDTTWTEQVHCLVCGHAIN